MADDVSCPEFNSNEAECLINSDSCLWIEPYCTEIINNSNPLFDSISEESEKQIVEINSDVTNDTSWTPSALRTYGTKYLIRGKEALTWSLNIKDSGFHNDAIQASYNKVLTIVNSLFILGLLAIAAMWMFSILIPRRYLKRVIIVYAGAVIFINFALPLNRLLIDSSNLLQSTLLMQDGKSIGITEIVQTPKYEEAIGYRNSSQNITSSSELHISPNNSDGNENMEIAKVDANSEPATGSITNGLGSESIELNMPEQSIVLNNNQTLSITQESKFNQYNEHVIFSFIMIAATGTAYFILALIFVLRIVILWALLILSPILFLLAIFKSTRGWFINWISIYGRWLLIGPLAALGIAIIVNIWQVVGLPIENSYVGDTFANNMTNVAFYLPGKSTPNTLSNTGEMMEYIVFLLMLYIPIFFAFALTRQKYITSAANGISERISRGNTSKEIKNELHEILTGEKEIELESKEISTEKKEGFVAGLKNIISTNISKITETAMPSNMTELRNQNAHSIQTASNFLPENLAITSIHKMMEMIGADKKSRHSRDEALGKLASPESIENAKERERISAVRNEIEKRSANGEPEAMMIMGELEAKLSNLSTPVLSTSEIHEQNNNHFESEVIKEKEIKIEGDNKKKGAVEQVKQSQDKNPDKGKIEEQPKKEEDKEEKDMNKDEKKDDENNDKNDEETNSNNENNENGIEK